jgi:FAD/FMN-containing dehydrogenase
MTTVSLEADQVEKLQKGLRGAVLQPSDDGYEAARRIWNGMIDKRPAAIARCVGPADVMAAVRFARERQLPIAVRGGGHNVAGRSVCDDGLVIDLAPMRAVRVDPSRSRVRVGGGALLGDIDHEAQAFGMAVPVGAVSETGIGGLALHGGFGFLTRKYGLTADNLVSADVVTADGTLITADETNHPDLLWALKGGGGNFGVVTSFEFQLHPVGPEVYFVLTFYPAAEAARVLERFRSFMPGAPDELMAIAIYENAPQEAFIPETYRGEPVVIVAGCWCGPLEKGEGVTEPLRTIATPVVDLSGPMPYLDIQRLFDADYPKGDRYYWKSLYLDDLSDEVIELACAAGAERPTPRTGFVLWALGGAMGRVPPEATAFYHRDAPFLLSIEATDSAPANDEANLAWVRRWYDKVEPLTRRGTYFNFGGFWEGGEEMLARSFGSNYARLREVKAKYDPDNVFTHNLAIPVGEPLS